MYKLERNLLRNFIETADNNYQFEEKLCDPCVTDMILTWLRLQL